MHGHYSDAFYSTVATLIPVLFLALALQGDALTQLFDASARWHERGSAASAAVAPSSSRFRRNAAGAPLRFASAMAHFSIYIVLFYAVLGEILALRALEQGEASADSRSAVMGAGIAMTCAVTVAFVARLVPKYRAEQPPKAGDSDAS